ncbi:MAG: ribonuclease R family protein [Cyanobacteria bacterium P01_H01_bin.15]
MKFSIAALMSHFEADKLVAAKYLEKRLDCQTPEDISKLQISLDALEQRKILLKERGKYRRNEMADVVEAKLRCSSKGFCFAIQDDDAAEDIYIRESHLSYAWNGDRVLVKIIKEGSRRRSPEGEVQLILERANPSLLARTLKKDQNYRALPLDDRLLFEIDLIDPIETLENADNHLVHVSITRYPLGKHLPQGSITKVLGSDAEAAADTDIVVCKHDLSQVFSDKSEAAAQELCQSWPSPNREHRYDLREFATLTFCSASSNADEQQAPIIENAFSLVRDGDDWQLGIHIIDVASYVDIDSPLEEEAGERGTSIHLGERNLPLFPSSLLEKLSLKTDQDFLAHSVILTLDRNGGIIEFSIVPSIIQVDRAFTYTEVQDLLNGNNNDELEPPLLELLNDLFFKLAPLVKVQRLQRGGFEITLTDEILPTLDEGRWGVIVNDPQQPIRTLLSELAILGGWAVAQHLQGLGVPAIYCTQPHPDWDQLDDLLKLVNNIGLDFLWDPEAETRPQDYQQLVQAISTAESASVLNYLLKSTLHSVRYTTRPCPHFGLAYSDGYVHCLSPLQRYGDLFIQRVLTAVFEHGRDRRHARTKVGVDLTSSVCYDEINWNVLPPSLQNLFEEVLQPATQHLNDREKVAEDAESDLIGLKKSELMKARIGQTFFGLITGVQSYGFFVEIEDLLVEGLVHVSSLKDDWYEFRSRQSCLVGRKNRLAYKLGDRVEVEVKSVDYYRQQVDLATTNDGNVIDEDDLTEKSEQLN